MKHYHKQDYHSYETILLANGAFPTATEALLLLNNWIEAPHTRFLACCDGAVNNLQAYTSRLPDIVVGDLDSVSSDLREQLSERIIHIAEQDTNDLTKTMKHLTHTLGKKRITMLGITGKRDDHMLGNIAWLTYYAPWVDELVAVTDTGYFRLITEDSSLEVSIGQQISLFSFGGGAISTSGLHWELKDTSLPYLWSGTLNRADQETIEIRTQHPLLVFVAQP